MNTLRVLAVASLSAACIACGQKGPLVLPDAQHPHKRIGILKPAPIGTTQQPTNVTSATPASAATP